MNPGIRNSPVVFPWCFMFQTAGEYDILPILIAHTREKGIC
jgi:hypothetical protein